MWSMVGYSTAHKALNNISNEIKTEQTFWPGWLISVTYQSIKKGEWLFFFMQLTYWSNSMCGLELKHDLVFNVPPSL